MGVYTASSLPKYESNSLFDAKFERNLQNYEGFAPQTSWSQVKGRVKSEFKPDGKDLN